MGCRFSILIPSYNRKDLLRITLDSVLSQTFRDFELIVIDDGSTDGTLEMLATYGKAITVLRQSHQGPEEARRWAATIATGEYLALLDSDDLLLPWALATYNEVIREFHAPALIIGALHYFRHGEASQPAQPSPEDIRVLKCRDYLSKDIPLGMSSSNIVVRRSVFQDVGAFECTFPTFPLDTHHYLLMFGTASPCVIIQHPKTVGYRIHPGNTIRNVAGMVQGCLSLVEAERRGLYSGGPERRFDRYVCIGGISLPWIWRGFKHGLFGMASKTLSQTVPMLLAGSWRKATRRFRQPAPLVRVNPRELAYAQTAKTTV